MINEINSFRANNTPPRSSKFEYLTWTSISGENGAYDLIIQLINESLRESLKTITVPDVRQKYYLQLVELTEQQYLQSIRDSEKRKLETQKFDTQRSELVIPFVENDQFDHAVG